MPSASTGHVYFGKPKTVAGPLKSVIGVLKVRSSPQHIESMLSTFLHLYAGRYPNVRVKLIEAAGADTFLIAHIDRLLDTTSTDASSSGSSALGQNGKLRTFNATSARLS